MNTQPLVEYVSQLVLASRTAIAALGDRNYDEWEIHRERVFQLIPIAQRIALRIQGAPEPADFEPDDDGRFGTTHQAALRLQGLLLMQSIVDDALATDVPTVGADQLHPWVWEAASSLWADNHHRQAIHAAASQIENRLQALINRGDVSGVALVREAFTLNAPTTARPRLRFAWLQEGTEAYKSAHEGAMNLAAGCFGLIRNSAAHGVGRLATDAALEQLVCLSYVARLIDSATTVAVDDVDDSKEPERPFG